MKKTATILVLAVVLVNFGLISKTLADKRFNIRSPRGNRVTLVITNQTLKNIRIYDLDFSNDGETFFITAAPIVPSDSSHTLSVNFQEGATVVQSEYVDIGPEKTVQEVYCPEDFNQIVIDYSGF
ncbi:MAG: hypothetical protein GWN93_27945 [Deltaproteobacteria bacterium]|nr:hypothetical protein [Deltaproteobacteria bacterium]